MANFTIFLLILLVIAAFLRVEFFFNILYFLFASYVISRWWVQRAIRQVVVERKFVRRGFQGDVIPVELRIRNTGWLPVPWLELRDSVSVQLKTPPFFHAVIGLGPHEERRMTYRLRCRLRGYYTIGPLMTRTSDLLGLHERSARPLTDEHVIVYPEVLPLQALNLPTHSPLVVLKARSPLFRDPTRVMGVRDYQVGDSPRHVHWSASASAGQLLVKQYDPAVARETLICLDFDLDAYALNQRYTATELAITTAASLANHIILREGLPVGLATAAWDPLTEAHGLFSLPPRKERAQLMHILEILARVQARSEPEQSFVTLLRQQSAHLAWGATVVAVTPQEDPALLDTLLSLRQRGFAVALILISPLAPQPALDGRAESLGIPVYHVWRKQDVGGLS
jgi:uncharacterized protein (DUF58 family)